MKWFETRDIGIDLGTDVYKRQPHLHLEYYENDAHKEPMKAMKQ